MQYFYFDTSALAKRYSQEKGSNAVNKLIETKDNIIIIGNIAITELYAALSKKLRTREITLQDLQYAIYLFEADIAKGTYKFLEIDNQTIKNSKMLILSHPNLRAYDSIHLALALELLKLNPTVVTSDSILLETCKLENLKVIDPSKT